ncbi:selenium cofactor biosynthesis protein YqeC [Pelosinus sp. sgz500959]|uniref:selenium cofactor biosynthesis protein YqeC n=1 Tax=Pelosinus sp. sgz500959 TaxID=3242472 RepID=UPI00366CF4A7
MRKIWYSLISNLRSPKIVTIIGGGGKTSLMYYLLKIVKEQGEMVIATTTTKLCSQQMSGHSFVQVQSLSAACQVVKRVREKEEAITLVYGEDHHFPGKIVGIPQEWIDELGIQYPGTLFVVEGDGSAGKSLKGHLGYEPVIPSKSSLVIIVIGIDSIGVEINSQHVHRPERICELVGAESKSLVTTDLITQLLFHPQGYLHHCSPDQLIIPFINKVESVSQQQKAKELAQKILANKHPQIGGIMIGSVMKEEGLWLQA